MLKSELYLKEEEKLQKDTTRRFAVNIFNGLSKNKLSGSYLEFLIFLKYIAKEFKLLMIYFFLS